MQEIDKTIGIRLAAFMAAHKVDRHTLAAALGCTTVRVRRYEKGTSPMRASELVAAAKCLGITSAILTGEESFKPAEAAQ